MALEVIVEREIKMESDLPPRLKMVVLFHPSLSLSLPLETLETLALWAFSSPSWKSYFRNVLPLIAIHCRALRDMYACVYIYIYCELVTEAP